MSRPRLNDELIQRLTSRVVIGMSFSEAALAEGVSKGRAARWLKRGREGTDENGKPVAPDSTPTQELCIKLYEAIEAARPLGMGAWLRSMHAAATTGYDAKYDEKGRQLRPGANPDWHAADKMLARTDPARWGDRLRVDSNVTMDATVRSEEIDWTAPEMQPIAKQLEEALRAKREREAREARGEGDAASS